MTKKAFTVWFTIISTLLNILFTAAIIAVLAVVATVVMNKMIGVREGHIYIVVWMMCFLTGMVLGMFLFGKISAAVIDRHNLAGKLDARVIGKYLPNGKVNRYAQETEDEKIKTVMPDSVKEEEDSWGKE